MVPYVFVFNFSLNTIVLKEQVILTTEFKSYQKKKLYNKTVQSYLIYN